MKLNTKYDVAIIGAGPAGMSAALYAIRAGLSCVIFEGDAPGGALNKTYRIENYPGYVDQEGTGLAFKMYSQLEGLKANLKVTKVLDIKKRNDFEIITSNETYLAKYIIIASGRIPRKLDVENASEFEGKGISYCSICDGALYKGKDVVVVGGGNSAMEAASYLGSIANKVYVLNRSDNLRATKREIDDATSDERVEIIYNAKIKEIQSNDDKEITGVTLEDGKSIKASGIFVYIGNDANDAYYQNLNLKTGKTGIIVDNDMKTSDDSVYACGDAISKSLYQVVTATSEGAIAASSIISKIKKVI